MNDDSFCNILRSVRDALRLNALFNLEGTGEKVPKQRWEEKTGA